MSPVNCPIKCELVDTRVHDIRQQLLPAGLLGGIFFAGCVWPVAAHANVGVPVFANFAAYSWLLLLPIIGIETYLLRTGLNLPLGRAIGVAAYANLMSTILGSLVVFIVGVSLAVPGFMVLPGATSDLAVLVVLVPCFYLSVWCETRVAGPFLKASERKRIWEVFFLANKFSYAMLGIVAIANFFKNWILQGYIVW